MNLIDAMRTEYARSKNWLRWAFIVSAGLYLMTLGSALCTTGWQAKALGVIAGVAQIALFAFRYWSGSHFSLGEEIRRLAMLQDGLGIRPPEIQIAKLRERVGKSQVVEPDYLGPYYESRLPAGPKRLLEIIEESAFFTHSLARTTATVLWITVCIGLFIVVISFVVFVQAGIPRSALEAAAKIVVISMTFWAAGDLASMALRFGSLARASERVLDRCPNLLAQKDDVQDEAHIIIGEYNCAVIQAPSIPTVIYRWRQDTLNEAWRNRRIQEGAESHAP